jgi:putative salt-induced outer membrane protein YdiY
VHGQVNVEAVRGDADRQGFSGRVEASATGSTGNTEGIAAGASGRIQLRSGSHLGFLYSSGSYTRLNRTTSIARALTHTRYNYEIESWLWGEAFGQLEHDAFRRLTNRELLGVGPRFQLLDTEDLDLFYGTSYMAEWENLNLVDADTRESLTLSHRWSHYVTLSVSLAERLDAGSTTYVQPRFDRFSDHRVLNETFLEVGITDVVSVKVSTWMRHDSDPPEDVKSTDFTITNAFVGKF